MRRGMKQLPCFQHVLEKCPKINVILKSSVCFKSPKERSVQALQTKFAPGVYESQKCFKLSSVWNVSLQHADAPSSRYWAVSAVISNSHVDCWLLYICPKLWARQHNISSCESPGSCSTMGEKLCQALPVKSVMKRSWQVAASFPIMPPSLSRGHKNEEKEPKKKKQNWGHLQLLNVHMKICWKHYFPLLFVLCNQRLLNTLEHGKFTELSYWRSLFILRLHAECGRTFSFFNICLKPASWSIIQNSTGSLLPQSPLSVDRAAAERSQPGWKCVKKGSREFGPLYSGQDQVDCWLNDVEGLW